MDHILNSAGKKLFERHLEQYAPVDPLYEYYTDRKGKQRRKRASTFPPPFTSQILIFLQRGIPPGLSSRDAKILKSVQRRAHYLDKGFSLCGFRFGWTFIIGIIPGAGDVADASLNYLLVVRKARQADIPHWLLRRMLVNNAVSAAVGFIPIAGDIVMASFKANSRNAALLEEFLRIRGDEFLKIQAQGANAKGKGAGKMVAPGVTKTDAEQVKPGAGIEAGGKDTVTGAVPGDLTVMTDTPAQQPASSSTPTRTPGSGKSGKSLGRKGFGAFFAKKAPSAGDKGRFVENVDNPGAAV
ncbi:hypothetical protein D9757_001329 [Collybiopsis confluens]|uniref:Uncharacterized protein n=1 Tax=Collybiopsis confluens TaxID=2823264 RepID=A0A8H5I0Z6_9AGAR|nr:hypothetical protein D9757_001329 [Collybiopsis confluens]